MKKMLLLCILSLGITITGCSGKDTDLSASDSIDPESVIAESVAAESTGEADNLDDDDDDVIVSLEAAFENPAAVDEEVLALEDIFEEHDLNYYFYLEVQEGLDLGYSEEEAVQHVKDSMKRNILLYNYAKAEGHSCTDEIIEEVKESWRSALGDDERIESYIENAGSLIDYLYVNQSFYQEMQEAFNEGDDTIDGTAYDNFNDYWNALLLQELYDAAEDEESREIDAQLEAAEEYYREMQG